MKKIILALIFASSAAIAQTNNHLYYPKNVERLRLNDTVTLSYDIDAKGHATNIKILNAEHPALFKNDIIHQMHGWRFEPGHPKKDQHLTAVFKMTQEAAQ